MTKKRPWGTPFELLLVGAALGLAAYVGWSMLKIRGMVPLSSPAGGPAGPVKAVGADVDPLHPENAEPPKAGSVTRMPRIKVSVPPKPSKRPKAAVPAPDGR